MDPLVAPVLGDTGSVPGNTPEWVFVTRPDALTATTVMDDETALGGVPAQVILSRPNPVVSPFDPGPGLGGRFVIPSTIAFG